jgi:hypothetical protein
MQNRQFARKLIHHEARIDAPVERVFPLLCPVREYEWIDGWSCELIYSESGFAEIGAVFTTGFRAEGFSVWAVSRYEPNRAIEFVVIFPESHVMTIALSLESIDVAQTKLTWKCAYTSLVAHNAFVDGVNQDAFDHHQAFFDRALEHYCKTGKMLRRDAASS